MWCDHLKFKPKWCYWLTYYPFPQSNVMYCLNKHVFTFSYTHIFILQFNPDLKAKPPCPNFSMEDHRSSGLQRNSEVENAQKIVKIVPKGVLHKKIIDRCLERVQQTLIMANKIATWWQEPLLTPVWLLTGRPMQSREPLQRQNSNNDGSQDQVPTVQENTSPTTPTDPINRLAELLVGMNNRPSAQTLMVRPVSTTTLTFDGKSEKLELLEDLFHTMIKMQRDMTETTKINHFHSLLRKNALQTFRNINTTNRQTLEDIFAVFRRKYVKPESQATAKHKRHRLVFDPNTTKLPDFLEELNQGAEKALAKTPRPWLIVFFMPNCAEKTIGTWFHWWSCFND